MRVFETNASGYQVETVSDQFAANLRESLSVEQITDLWTETVNQSLQPSSITIWLNHPHPPEGQDLSEGEPGTSIRR